MVYKKVRYSNLRLYKRIYLFIRIQKPITRLLGPKYTRSRRSIQIDITYQCNLKCINCNRSCKQAPSNEQISLKQIQKFVDESIHNNIKWGRVSILGGEPTLHPDIFEILDLLLKYKNTYSPDTTIEIFSNGTGETVNNVLSKISKEIEVTVTHSQKISKTSGFYPFNNAPKDSIVYKFSDYSNGCWIISNCGMGLTPRGYYPCAIAGAIDRIFGFNCGKKELPSNDESMVEQLQIFCRLCGHFKPIARLTNKEIMSSTWKKAYKKYNLTHLKGK